MRVFAQDSGHICSHSVCILCHYVASYSLATLHVTLCIRSYSVHYHYVASYSVATLCHYVATVYVSLCSYSVCVTM